MKQGRKYLKVIMLVLVFMVASYILYNIIRSASSGVATIQAVYYSTSEGLSTEGYIVRRESRIVAAYDLVLPTRNEGEKVAQGEEVALCLKSDGARERQEEIDRLETELEQLRLALSYQTQLTDNIAVTQRIYDTAAEFSAQVAQGRLEAANGSGGSLKSLVLRQLVGGSGAAGLQSQISQLESQLGTLKSGATADTVSVTVEAAGYYSAVTDGYEAILTPELLETITPEAFQRLWEGGEGPDASGRTAGRLITSARWYYATLVDKSYLEDISLGQTLTVALGGDVDRTLSMTVERADRSGEDMGLLVLSSKDRLSDVSALRTIKADIVFHAYSGLRVPKEAVCYSEESGSAGVYVLVSGKAVWKDIQLLYDNGDTYIAQLDQSTTSNLWPEDLILLDTEDLYDGKVVEGT